MPDAPSLVPRPKNPKELVVIVCREHVCTDVDGQIDPSRRRSVENSKRPDIIVDEFRNGIKRTLSPEELARALKEARVKAAPFMYRDIEDPDGSFVGGELLARVIEFGDEEMNVGTTECFWEAARDSKAWLEIDLKMIENAAFFSSRIENFVASINVSADVLRSGRFESAILKLLDSGQLIPQNLCLEILEKIKCLTEEDIALLGRLNAKGIKLAIDDYGEENSEDHLARLLDANLKPHAIKIAGDITRDIMSDDQAKIRKCVKKAIDSGAKLFVFEGGGKGKEKTKITRPLIARLNVLKKELGSEAQWVTQGPIVEDDEPIAA